MTQRTVSSWLQQWTCVGGTCAPSPPIARNAWERALDTYTGLTAPVLRGCWAIPVGGGVYLISRSLGGAALSISGLYFLAYAAYCLANFARCREAHCIITGLGWSVLGTVTVVAAALQLPWFAQIWFAFVGVAVIGHGFELIWAATRGTHVLRV